MANAFTPEQIAQILEEFFKTVGTRQYIGARYVPLFGRKDETSIEWDNTKPYEPLTVVLYMGNSYTSRQYVPTGVQITNEEFWAVTGNYNAQIEQYRRETARALQAAQDAQTSADNAQDDIDTLLPKADFSSENTVKDYIDNINSQKAFAFDAVNDMKNSENLFVGAICHTNGYHAINDGGAAWYVISDTGTENGMDVIACGNLIANLISDKSVVPEQYGAYGDANHDDSEIFNYIISLNKNIIANSSYLLNTVKITGANKNIYIHNAVVTGNNYISVENLETSTLTLNHITGDAYGVKFIANNAPVQLNKITILSIYATTACVEFEYVTGNNTEWINENTFDIRLLNNGSLQDGIGINIKTQNGANYSKFNGNVFENCDFEQNKYGIVIDAGAHVANNKFVNLRTYEIDADQYMIQGKGGYFTNNALYPKSPMPLSRIVEPNSTFQAIYYNTRNTIYCDIATDGNRTVGKNAFITYDSSLHIFYTNNMNTRAFNDDNVDLRINNALEYKFKYVAANIDIYLPVSIYAYNQYAYLPICFNKQSANLTTITVHIGENDYTVDVSSIAINTFFSIVIINGNIPTAVPQIITLDVN